MKLPNAANALVEREKIVEYLLDAAHPDNGGKAAFFISLGYTSDDWQSLAAAFCLLATVAEVAKSVDTLHGTKYVVDGGLEAVGGMPTTRPVRTIWIVDAGLDRPRLVTAYPRNE